MVYIRKTKDIYELWIDYGYHGFECVTAETSYREIRKRLKEYRENEGLKPSKIVKRREKIS